MKRAALATLAAAIVAATVLAYLPTFRNGFVSYDDGVYITENPGVSGGLSLDGLRWALTTRHGSNWHPLTWVSHQLDVTLFGLHPAGHHAVSLLLHVANALLLLRFLSSATGSLLPSAAAAALFALHPLAVESVAWAADRKNVLSTLFLFLGLNAYLALVRRPALSRHAALLLLFALGLASKGMLVTVPLLLLLLDLWPLGRLAGGAGRPAPARVLLEKLPLAALTAAGAALTLWAQSTFAMESVASFPPDQRIANAVYSLALYLRKAAWPLDLAYFYPHPHRGILAWQTLLAAAVVAGLSLAAWRWRRRAPAALIGWLWYLVACLPILGLVQVGLQGAADRYTYVPLVGIFFAAAFALAPAVRGARLRAACATGVCILLAAFAALTWRQTRSWADSASLTAQSLKVMPGNFYALNDLGTQQVDAGRYAEAIETFRAALASPPEYPRARFNLGVTYYLSGQYEEAIPQLDRAVQDAAALLPLARGFLADSHARVGLDLARQGQTADAMRHLEEALRLDPANRKARLTLDLLRRAAAPETERVP
jgi:tetratricopeptide (TPR) repeat protein